MLDDEKQPNADEVKKVIFCSGKLYFELNDKREKDNRTDVAIIRLEQLYPLPQNQLNELYKKYKNAVWYWVQEEPLNMGAAGYLRMNLNDINFYIISRKASAATASGYSKIHAKEQSELIEKAFSI